MSRTPIARPPRPRRFACVLALLLTFTAVSPGTVLAQTGFSDDGIVTTAIGSSHDQGYSVAVQDDGKIVVAGRSHNGSNSDLAVVRYNSDGTLDPSFDGDGIVTTAIGSSDDYGYAVVLSDGKIVVAGLSWNDSDADFAVVRYNADGTLDASFDGDGMVTTAIGSSSEEGHSVVVQGDGKIVVAGFSWNGSNTDVAVVRYNSDGTLDASFDGDGMVTTAIGPSNDGGYSVAVQGGGKIVVAGFSSNGSNTDVAVVRYNSDGTLDASFDGDGIVTTAIGPSNDGGYSVGLSDGKIVVTGYAYNGLNYDFAVVRYNADGTLDASFDGDGMATTAIGPSEDYGHAMAVQSDGKIVVVGYSRDGSDDFAVVRYNADGTLDTGFSGDGKVTTAVGSSTDQGYSVAGLSDGRIVVAGFSWNGSNYDFAAVRYENDGELALPVELVSFTAQGDGTDTVLRWETASETNNAGFEVETVRSEERGARNVWTKLAFVEGHGTTTEAQTYTYRANGLAPGLHRFRLKQIDYDGAFEYSPEVEVIVEMPEAFVLEPAYPNPFNPSTTIRFAVRGSQAVRVVLYDAMGRLLRVLYAGTPAAGQLHTVRVDGSGLSSGPYFVRLSGEGIHAVQQLLLVK